MHSLTIQTVLLPRFLPRILRALRLQPMTTHQINGFFVFYGCPMGDISNLFHSPSQLCCLIGRSFTLTKRAVLGSLIRLIEHYVPCTAKTLPAFYVFGYHGWN